MLRGFVSQTIPVIVRLIFTGCPEPSLRLTIYSNSRINRTIKLLTQNLMNPHQYIYIYIHIYNHYKKFFNKPFFKIFLLQIEYSVKLFYKHHPFKTSRNYTNIHILKLNIMNTISLKTTPSKNYIYIYILSTPVSSKPKYKQTKANLLYVIIPKLTYVV